jgi:hypothetical protein
MPDARPAAGRQQNESGTLTFTLLNILYDLSDISVYVAIYGENRAR